MASNIKLPDFDFAVFYYGEIIEALLQHKRENIPEITTENPFDPGIQMLRSFALIGHLNNTLLDLVAQECYLDTANLRDSVVRQLRLIAYIAAGNIPARSVLRMELSQGFASPTLVVPDNALFGTRRRADTPEVLFEADASLTVNATDQIDGCWQLNTGSGAWLDKTAAANLDSSLVTLTAAVVHHFYLMHDSVLTDSISFEGITQGLDLGDDRVASPTGIHLQYFDGELEDDRPDLVTFPGSVATAIRFDINTLVGDVSKVGTYVTIALNSTGASARLPVQWDGVDNYIETDGFLGQSIVSTDVGDYTVGSYWHDIDISTDTTLTTPPVVAGEPFDTGDGGTTSFGPNALARWPLEPDTVVTWSYLVGATPTTATYDMSDGTLGGGADAGTVVDPATGIASLETLTAPDSGAFTVSYFRKAQTLQQDGELTFAVPLSGSENWVPDELPDELRGSTGPTESGFWVRLVITTLGNGLVKDLIFDRLRWDRGQMYLRVPVTQGETVESETLGSGDGTASQEFTTSESPVINGSILLTVDGTPWTEVEDFFSSDDTDEHFTVDIDSDGFAAILTGDGINGKVVPTGVNNVVVEYRIGGAEDGNVGSDQIIVNRTGVSRVRSVTNPRPATGWIAQEGSGDEVDLERLKRVGVSSLRIRERATSPTDVEFLTVQFEASDGSKPYSRSRAIENGFGLKTIKNVVVPAGAVVPSSIAKREELDLYFNGDLAEGGVTPGVGPTNHDVQSIDYAPVTINVTATVVGGDEPTLRAALRAALQPEALLSDGLTYRWKYGQNVPPSSISALFFGADSNVQDVTLSAPAATVVLGDEELPRLGTLTLTVVAP